MKRYIFRCSLLGLVALGVNSACAKKRTESRVSCVYSYAPSVIMTDIARTDTATVVSFLLEGVPGTAFRIPGQLYLDDSQHRRYRLIGTEGISPTGRIVCPLSEQVRFSLRFEPLPSKEKVFDLLSAEEHYRRFAFLGITESSRAYEAKVKMDTQKCHEDGVRENGRRVVVKGYFEGSHPEGLQVSLPRYKGGDGNEKFMVSGDGSFEFTRELEGPTWTYLHDIKTQLPIFLNPGDTLSMRIFDCYETESTVEYESSRGFDVHGQLMKAAPYAISSVYFAISPNTPATTRELKAIAEEVRAKDMLLWRYLVWKYSLDEEDAHLLHVHLHSQLLYVLNSCVHRKLSKAYPTKDMLGDATMSAKCQEIISSEEMAESYWFMREIDLSDQCVLTVPNQYIREVMLDSYPAIMAYFLKGRRGALDMLEKLIGIPLTEQWKEETSEKYKED